MQSERKISYPKKEESRRKSNIIFDHNMNLGTEPLRFESFGKDKNIEILKQDVDWQNQSFGDSDEHNIFGSKRMIDANAEDSESENEGQNFSFCESEPKTKRKQSCIVDQNIDHQFDFDVAANDDLNMFSETLTTEKLNIEQALRRPTSVIIPSYIDTGEINSYY